MEPALTFANTSLDLQIAICMFLHPSDILALRKTCKALELATRNRIIWVAALHRVCLDNALFLPSFPILDMSNLELERAAMAPLRWIDLGCTLQKRYSNKSSEMLLLPRTTRIINSVANFNSVFIVPGGRYLVIAGNGITVWDLGYVSTTVDCKLVASARLGDSFDFCMVQATLDGKGLVIVSSNHWAHHLSIFEIFPQSEVPLLTQIAHLDWSPGDEEPAHLLPDILICRVFYEGRIVFRVVDYRTKYTTCFSADVNFPGRAFKHVVETFATKTAIIVLCKEGIFIWAIPPLSPQPSDLPDRFLDDNPIHIPPLFKFPYPDGIVLHTHENFDWILLSSWYFGSWESVYFDILYSRSKLQRFKIVIKPDLSDASLHLINMSETVSGDLKKTWGGPFRVCEGYRICEDSLVYYWHNHSKTDILFTGLGLISTSSPFTNVVTRWDGFIKSLCPTSGRFVYLTDDDYFPREIVVVDLF